MRAGLTFGPLHVEHLELGDHVRFLAPHVLPGGRTSWVWVKSRVTRVEVGRPDVPADVLIVHTDSGVQTARRRGETIEARR